MRICTPCYYDLKKNIVPSLALSRGLWIGDIPEALSHLTFVEKMLIARVCHNHYVVKVTSGRYKMKALAFIFTGPCKPTAADIERTPMLVRQDKVKEALNWLVLNNKEYADVLVSNINLSQYPVCGAAVTIDYCQSILNRAPEAMSVHDQDNKEGTERGPCLFLVQGLSGDEYTRLLLQVLKAKALQHLTSNSKILFVGHAKDPLSLFRNPGLYSSMFLWLFPYSKGGPDQKSSYGKLSLFVHKGHLLLYHDKQF